MGCIYKVTCLTDKRMSYVGATYRTAEQRWGAHCRAAKSGLGTLLHADIRRFGKSKFKVETLASVKDSTELAKLEKILIIKHCTLYPTGYNLTTGGDEEFHVERTKRKMSRAKRKNDLDPVYRAKISRSVSLAKSTPEGHKKVVEAAIKSWETRRKNFTSAQLTAKAKRAARKRDNSGNASKGWVTRRQKQAARL